MNPDSVVRIMREGMMLMIVISAGPLAVSLLTGLIVSLLQAATNVQEATLTFVPKLIAVSLTLLALGPWMLNEAVRFMRLLFDSIGAVK